MISIQSEQGGSDKYSRIQYEETEKIGSSSQHGLFIGSFGLTKVAVRRRTGPSAAQKEIEALSTVRSFRVVRYITSEVVGQYTLIATEWHDTSLYELVMVKEVKDRMGVKILDVLKEAARGLAAFHSYQYAHQNLKASNVLISKRMEQLVVVISDLGRSKMQQGGLRTKPIFRDLQFFGTLLHFSLSDAARLAPDWTTFVRDEASWNLDGLGDKSDRYLAKNLITRLNNQAQFDFPSALIEHHPLFWKDHLKLEYFSAISEQFSGKNQYLMEKQLLEHNASGVIATNFSVRLGVQIKKTAYNTKSVYDLIRFIRNKRAHYQEDVLNGVHPCGTLPTQFLKHFTSSPKFVFCFDSGFTIRLLQLLTHTFAATQHLGYESAFEKFYPAQMSLYSSLSHQHQEWITNKSPNRY